MAALSLFPALQFIGKIEGEGFPVELNRFKEHMILLIDINEMEMKFNAPTFFAKLAADRKDLGDDDFQRILLQFPPWEDWEVHQVAKLFSVPEEYHFLHDCMVNERI